MWTHSARLTGLVAMTLLVAEHRLDTTVYQPQEVASRYDTLSLMDATAQV